MRLDLEGLRRLRADATPGPLTKGKTSIRGEALLQIGSVRTFSQRSVQLPAKIVDMFIAQYDALPALLTRAEVYEAARELRLAELEWCQAGDLEGGQYMAAFNRVGDARKALDAAVARVQEVENG